MANKRSGYRSINEKYKRMNDEIRSNARGRSIQDMQDRNLEQKRRVQANKRRREILNERRTIKHETDFGKTIRLSPEMIERERQRILKEKQRKRKEQQRRRRNFLVLIFLLLIALGGALIAQNIFFRADSSKVQKKPANLITENPKSSEETGVTLLKFNRTGNVTKLYQTASTTSEVLTEVLKDSYVENHGVTGEFTEVVLNGQRGFIQTKDLVEISDSNQFKVEKSLLLVNDQYYLPSDYDPGMNPDAKKSFEMMAQEASKKKLTLKSASDYRTFDQQERLYNENTDIGYMQPGHCEHQAGLAYDVMGENYDLKYKDGFKDTQEYKWLQENAHKYGFILRYPEGKEKETGHKFAPWQWRYVGVRIATEMKENNLSLEEYLNLPAQNIGTPLTEESTQPQQTETPPKEEAEQGVQ